MQGPLRNVVWSQFARAVQMLQPVGLIEQVVVELYSPAVQWVQMMVVVVVEMQ